MRCCPPPPPTLLGAYLHSPAINRHQPRLLIRTAIAGTHPHIGRGWFKAEEADTDGLLPKISVVFSKAEPQPLLSKQSLIKKSRERMMGPQLHYSAPSPAPQPPPPLPRCCRPP